MFVVDVQLHGTKSRESRQCVLPQINDLLSHCYPNMATPPNGLHVQDRFERWLDRVYGANDMNAEFVKKLASSQPPRYSMDQCGHYDNPAAEIEQHLAQILLIATQARLNADERVQMRKEGFYVAFDFIADILDDDSFDTHMFQSHVRRRQFRPHRPPPA